MRLRDGRVVEHDEPVNRGSAERPLARKRCATSSAATPAAPCPPSGRRRCWRPWSTSSRCAAPVSSASCARLAPRARRGGGRRADDGAAAHRPAHPGSHPARRRALCHDDAGRPGRRDHQDRGSDHRRRRGAQRAALRRGRRQPLLPVAQPQRPLAHPEPARCGGARPVPPPGGGVRRRVRQPARRPARPAGDRLREPEGRQPAHRLLHADRLRPHRPARRRAGVRLSAAGRWPAS